MAFGNELDDDLTEDSVEYQTVSSTGYDFALPISGFSTEAQRSWAETIGREVIGLRRDNRILRTQVDNVGVLAQTATNSVGNLTQVDNEESVEPLNPPSKPDITSRLGSLEIRWDGTDFEGLPMGKGFSHVNVYAVKTADLPLDPNFSLDEIWSDDTLGEETLPQPRTVWPPMPIGTITSNSDGSVLILTDLEYNTEYTIWFLSVDVRGTKSLAGEVAVATVVPLVNTDIIGRIIDGANVVLGTIDESLFDNNFRAKIADMEAGIEEAQTGAGGNLIWYRPTTNPPTGTHKVGDTWFVTDLDNAIRSWDGTQWTDNLLGTTAIADAAITNAKIGNLDAAKITTGVLSADRIAANSITGEKIAASTITSDQIAANTIIGDDIAANTITGANIQALSITSDELAANSITGTKLSATAIDGKTITGALIRTAATGQRLQLDVNGLVSYNANNDPIAVLGSSSTGLIIRAAQANGDNINDRASVAINANPSGGGLGGSSLSVRSARPAGTVNSSSVLINADSSGRAEASLYARPQATGKYGSLQISVETVPGTDPTAPDGYVFARLYNSSLHVRSGNLVDVEGRDIRLKAERDIILDGPVSFKGDQFVLAQGSSLGTTAITSTATNLAVVSGGAGQTVSVTVSQATKVRVELEAGLNCNALLVVGVAASGATTRTIPRAYTQQGIVYASSTTTAFCSHEMTLNAGTTTFRIVAGRMGSGTAWTLESTKIRILRTQ